MEYIKTFTANNMLAFLLITAALLWIFNLVGSSVETWRKMRKPKDNHITGVQDKLEEYDKFFAADKRRLDKHDGEIDDLRMGLQKNCKGVKALLNHQLHDGNTDEMQKAAQEIDNWLVTRR